MTIPLHDFFRNVEKTAFQMSPRGDQIAYMRPWKRRMNIFVTMADLSEEKQVTFETERDVQGYLWLSDQRIGFVKDQGGDENMSLYAVDIDGGNLRHLTPFDEVKIHIIDDLEDDDDHILIGMNNRDPRLHDAYRLNVHSGELKCIAENPGNIAAWLCDHQGQLRLAVTHDGVEESILYREQESMPFKKLLTTDFKESVTPLLFDFDDQQLIVSSNRGRDKAAIFRFNPVTAQEEELLFEHPEVDVSSVAWSKVKQKLTAVAYYTAKRGYHFFDAERARHQQWLEAQFPQLEVAVCDHNRQEDRWLVRTYSDKTRGDYYLYDTTAQSLQHLANISPWLKAEAMASMQPISYRSRDGLTIHGYLTLPTQGEAQNLPVVIHPHGGPWARDYWGFQSEVQFLANRGYAVLQMNFRGSTGYGRQFWQASFKQWGLAMQDDISDGVQYLIDQGIADPNRVAIYGASYGGYATLAGLAFTPSLYACGIDYVGVSNILTLLETLPPYWELGRQMMYEMVGDPEKELELLKAASPLFHVDKIEAPLLVAQGANDPRVKQAESDQIVAALTARGIDVPYILKENEGHGFANEENRFEFYEAMEAFLAKHLG